ncbi:MAG: hypothetical protein PHV17_02680 [Candidatus Omnitrophica bacterium]|nr:hypothetical protein [Candidatus Omnitrophota bacterium]
MKNFSSCYEIKEYQSLKLLADSSKKRGQKLCGRFVAAFTFIEVLISISILAFGLTAILKVFLGSLSAVRHVRNRLEANSLIENEKWQTIKLIRQARIGDTYSRIQNVARLRDYKVSVQASNLNDNYDFYSLDIDVAWKESKVDKRIKRASYLKVNR